MNSVTWINECVHTSTVRGGIRTFGKRFSAIRAFARKIDDREDGGQIFARIRVLIWAPPLMLHGEAISIYHRFRGLGRHLVYLSPLLELEKQNFVNQVVAHEFAHIYLGHLDGKGVVKTEAMHGAGSLTEMRRELEADTIASDWGFHRPKGVGRSQQLVVEYGDSLGKREREKLLEEV